MWGIDVVYGYNNVIGVILFFYNIGLGVINNFELIEKIVVVIVKEVMVMGIDWVFVLIVVVVCDDCWGCIYEGYFEDFEIVKVYLVVIVKGL